MSANEWLSRCSRILLLRQRVRLCLKGTQRGLPALLRAFMALLAITAFLISTVFLASCSDPAAEVPEGADLGRSVREAPNSCPVFVPEDSSPGDSSSGEGSGEGAGTTSGGDENEGTEPQVTMASGKNIIAALVLKSPSEIPLSELVDRLEFLEIDPERQHIEPFCVLVHGITEYGKYRIFDAETLEELDFVEPFGLPPQTYILGPTESGRSYIVELYQGEFSDDGETIIGIKYVFGVRAP